MCYCFEVIILFWNNKKRLQSLIAEHGPSTKIFCQFSCHNAVIFLIEMNENNIFSWPQESICLNGQQPMCLIVSLWFHFQRWTWNCSGLLQMWLWSSWLCIRHCRFNTSASHTYLWPRKSEPLWFGYMILFMILSLHFLHSFSFNWEGILKTWESVLLQFKTPHWQ